MVACREKERLIEVLLRGWFDEGVSHSGGVLGNLKTV
jgi:hypothetical protein